MTTPTVFLPSRFTVESMYELIRSLIDDHGRPVYPAVILDFSQLSYIGADGVTVLSNVIEWTLKRDVRVSFSGHNIERRAIKYLDDFGFFQIYLRNSLNPFAVPRNTTIPLQKVSHDRSYEWLEFSVIPWLSGKLNMTPASLADFKTCLKEIFNNVLDHSTEEIACTHIQWHPNIQRVRVSVSDFGIGIPAEISKSYAVEDDGHALSFATLDGISTKKNGRNRGSGLGILIENVVSRNGGTVGIYSNCGALFCRRQAGQLRRNHSVAAGFYPGTLFNIELRTDTIEPIEDAREDLEW